MRKVLLVGGLAGCFSCIQNVYADDVTNIEVVGVRQAGSAGSANMDFGSSEASYNISKAAENADRARFYNERVIPPYPSAQCKADRLNDHKECEARAFNAYTNSISTCNNVAIGGAGVAGAGATGLAFVSGPVGWGAYALGALTIGGGGAGAWGATSCATEKENTRESSLRDCDSAKEAGMAKCGE